MSAPAKGRKRKGHEEEHENHERWLVTYADMLTLLMVLFIVMFAISQVDQKKFAELKNGIASGFGAPSVAFAGADTSISDSQNTDFPLDIGSGIGGQQSDAEDDAVQAAVEELERAREQARQAAAQEEVENLEEIQQQITEALQQLGTEDSVQFTIDERGLVVTVITTSVVFAGDRAELLADGRRLLDAIGPALAPLPNSIEVDGHTNQLNVETRYYPSGWELSSARASTVVRYLHSNAGIAEDRLAAVGFGDTRPLYDPADPRSVTLNRRVEIVVLSTLPASERSLLPSAVEYDESAQQESESVQ